MPKSVIGKSTVESIQSGAVNGFVGMVDTIITKIREEVGCSMQVVATGGVVDWIAEQSEHIGVIDPFLTLEGLRIVHEKNKNP